MHLIGTGGSSAVRLTGNGQGNASAVATASASRARVSRNEAILEANAREWNIFAAQVQYVRAQERSPSLPQKSGIVFSCEVGGTSDKEDVSDATGVGSSSFGGWPKRSWNTPSSNVSNGSIINNDVVESERVGSALKPDPYHAFPDIVDNYAGYATRFPVKNGTLYQIGGSLNGIPGRFEWVISTDGMVTHRFFVENGIISGRSIRPW